MFLSSKDGQLHLHLPNLALALKQVIPQTFNLLMTHMEMNLEDLATGLPLEEIQVQGHLQTKTQVQGSIESFN